MSQAYFEEGTSPTTRSNTPLAATWDRAALRLMHAADTVAVKAASSSKSHATLSSESAACSTIKPSLEKGDDN
jgi:hypothetical protein